MDHDAEMVGPGAPKMYQYTQKMYHVLLLLYTALLILLLLIDSTAAFFLNVKKITLNTMLPEITKSCDKKKR